MTLFDVQQRITLAELSTPFIKYVVWNSDMSSVALLSKHAIVIADKKLGNAQTVHETIRWGSKQSCSLSANQDFVMRIIARSEAGA